MIHECECRPIGLWQFDIVDSKTGIRATNICMYENFSLNWNECTQIFTLAHALYVHKTNIKTNWKRY